MKGIPEHVCLLSLRPAGRDTGTDSPLFTAFCHMCKPCFLFSSVSLLGCRWFSGLPGTWEAGGAGRPWDRKAGKGDLGARDGPRLEIGPLLRNPEWARERGSSGKTLTTPRAGSAGPLPDDSGSAFRPLEKGKALRGSAKPSAIMLDTKLRVRSIILPKPCK